MKYNKKSREPQELTIYKTRPESSYKNMSTELKDQVKDSLKVDQGGLCGFCGRIIIKKSEIDHFYAIKHDVSKELDYNNFILSCPGNRKSSDKRKYPLTCNAAKGVKELKFKFNPFDPSIEDKFLITETGELIKNIGEKKEIKDFIKEVNLNYKEFKSMRKAIVEGLLYKLDGRTPKQTSELLVSLGRAYRKSNGKLSKMAYIRKKILIQELKKRNVDIPDRLINQF